jgi:hypothetical protein
MMRQSADGDAGPRRQSPGLASTAAAKTGLPQSNQARQVWISETVLGTALNTSFFASEVGLFAIVMGIALLLTGIGSSSSRRGSSGAPGSRKTLPRP